MQISLKVSHSLTMLELALNFNFSGKGKGRADLFEEQAPFLAIFKFRSKMALSYFK